MSIDLIQLAYYVAFGLLGWYLRHKTASPASSAPTNAAAPVNVDYTIQDALQILSAIQNHKLQLQDVQKLMSDLAGPLALPVPPAAPKPAA